MSTDASADRQDDLPIDDAAHSADVWSNDLSEPVTDPWADLFSAEIEDVDASDWEVDADQIWGDVTDQGGADDDGGLIGADFPL